MTSRQEPPPTDQAALQQDPVRLCVAQDKVGDPSAEWAVSLLREAARTSRPQGAKSACGFPCHRLARTGLPSCASSSQWLHWSCLAFSQVLRWRNGRPGWRTPSIPLFLRAVASANSNPAAAPGAPARGRGAGHAASARAGSRGNATAPSSEETPSLARPKRATKPASSEDMGPLLDAMRALRVERNPIRARALLTRILSAIPRASCPRRLSSC